MNTRYCPLILIAAVLLTAASSCKSTQEAVLAETPVEEVVPVDPEPQMLAVLYQQTAAEYRALCYQAFNLARWKLEEAIRNREGSTRLSIVVDIDETVLDNSPYEAKCLIENVQYPENWDAWMNAATAKAVPGALDFLNFARENGVEVFYISNRSQKYFNQTLQNLQRLKFPYSREDHVLLKRNDPSKKSRRQTVAERTTVVLLLGDNLNDFSEIFEGSSVQERASVTDRFSDKFGNRFIVLPNPMYGAWLSALYKYNDTLNLTEKARLREEALNSF
jgi:5'-nucleotidase (lipoprotein e(P4) family)